METLRQRSGISHHLCQDILSFTSRGQGEPFELIQNMTKFPFKLHFKLPDIVRKRELVIQEKIMTCFKISLKVTYFSKKKKFYLL